jgi:peptidoglycan/LPS O-acetylase OafA/YrhL
MDEMMTKDHSPGSNSGYMLQLDSLRAIAVTTVVIHHYIPDSFIGNLAAFGVRLFFVLSGFLITGILLRQKHKMTNYEETDHFSRIIKTFFIRRFIRLLPAYYITILISYILLKNIDISLIWHITYLSNIYFSFNNWKPYTSHFWSLSVEAQFYLIWPFIVLLNYQKNILKAIIIIIVANNIFRLLCLLLSNDSNVCYVMGCYDSLALGCLLSYCEYYQDDFSQKIHRYFLMISFWIGMPYFVLFHLTHLLYFNQTYLYEVFMILPNLFLGLVVEKASKHYQSFLGKILEAKPLVYLGKISYGIYLYHLIARKVVEEISELLNLSLTDDQLLRCLIFSIATVIISACSWHFIEQPINALKSKFT